MNSDVGYIRISSFNDQTAAELKQAIDAIKKAAGPNLKGFVLDLRNDPGGLLEQALLVANFFLDKGGIVSIRGRDSGETQYLQGPARRPHPWGQARCPNQRRFRIGLRDRRRRTAG